MIIQSKKTKNNKKRKNNKLDEDDSVQEVQVLAKTRGNRDKKIKKY